MTTTIDSARDEQQLVVFDLASESYGVDIGAVREIIRMQEITSMPRTPDYVEDVINLKAHLATGPRAHSCAPIARPRARWQFRQHALNAVPRPGSGGSPQQQAP